MIKSILSSLYLQLFAIFWAVYLFLDYIYHSNYFVEAFKYFEYTDLIISIILLAAVVTWLISNRRNNGFIIEIRNFRGVYHYGFILLVLALIMFFYFIKTGVAPSAGSGTLIYIFRTIILHLALALILFSALSIGTFITERLPFSFEKGTSLLISLAFGFFIITTCLFLLGVFGMLYQFVVFPFLIVLIIPEWKKTFSSVNQTLLKKSEPFKLHILAILAYVFIILLIALNLAFDFRPIPIGYDGIGLYMNTPKLIAGYHSLTSGGDAYNWSLMMSLGFILYNNPTIAILISVLPGILCLVVIYKICLRLKLSISWSLFSCALFYSLPNTIWQSKNDEKTDLALLFITLCSVLLFTGITLAKTPVKSPGRFYKFISSISHEMILWTICGLLIGFSFGIKYVAMLSIFAFLVVLFYSYSGKYGAIAIFFLNFAIIFGLDLTKFAAFERDNMFLRFIVPFILGIFAFALTFKNNRQGLVSACKKATVFLFAIGITFLPWAIKNVSENKKLSFDCLLTGKSPLPLLYKQESNITSESKQSSELSNKLKTPGEFSKTTISGFILTDISQIPEGQTQETEKARNNSQREHRRNRRSESVKVESNKTENSTVSREKEEEIRRYLGYENGIIRFISLPYDIVMKSNVRLVPSDSGILLLILIPLFMFVWSARQLAWNIFKIILLFFILAASLLSVRFFNGATDIPVMLDSIRKSAVWEGSFFGALLPIYIVLQRLFLEFGDLIRPAYSLLTTQSLGLSFVLIVLFTIPLYFLFKGSLAGLNSDSKKIIIFVYCVIQYWLVLSSGIIWYGIAGFSLVPVIIAIMANKEGNDSYSTLFIRRYICICAAIWFILILPFQFMPGQYLYAKDMNKVDFKDIFSRPFVKYSLGEYNIKDANKQFFTPIQLDILKTINSDKKSNVLNVSTFLNYYITNNDVRVYQDNQLGIFKVLYAYAKNDRLLLANEFRKNKIRYIIVSLKTPEIDVTPDKSLTKKFDELMIALVNNPEVRLVSTNRIVERPDGDLSVTYNGKVVVAKYDVIGVRVLESGTDALFEIL